MSKVWTEKLSQSEISFMNEIVSQVPVIHGAREAFVNCLQKLADSSIDPKFKYVMCATSTGDVMGTNDSEKARAYAADEDNFVIEVSSATWFCSEDDDDDQEIKEAK